MQAMYPRQSGARGLPGALPLAACVLLVLALAGCAAGITTPLPELPHTPVAAQMSQQDRQKAVEELERAGQTHEQAAEQQIEQSR
ncbi:MAG: hypothetical protein WDN31_03575 [Hyphomicrobium sp.]